MNTPQTVTINVPFTAKLEANKEYMGFIDHPNVSLSVHTTASKAKGQLKTKLIAEVDAGLRANRNGNTARLIACKDGTILVVRWSYDGWGYSMATPGRQYASSSQGGQSFEAVCESARTHADQSYGGVVWEITL